MARFLVERTIAGAAGLSADDRAAIAHKSNCALKHLNGVTWLHSYIAGEKFFCVYETIDEERIWEHARRGGFPIDRVTEISAVLKPSDAAAHQPLAA